MIDGLIFDSKQYRDSTVFNLGFDFLENDFISPFGHCKFEGRIGLKGTVLEEINEYYSEEKVYDIGEIRFHAYNLDKLGFDYFDKEWDTAVSESSLEEAMEVDSEDTSLYFSVFENGFDNCINGISLDDWYEMAMTVGEGYLVTLDRCYINPEYRKMGIGKYLHENLFKILYHEFNITTLFVVGICVPDEGESEDMVEVQKKVLSNAGFNVFKCSGKPTFCKYVYDEEFLRLL